MGFLFVGAWDRARNAIVLASEGAVAVIICIFPEVVDMGLEGRPPKVFVAMRFLPIPSF